MIEIKKPVFIFGDRKVCPKFDEHRYSLPNIFPNYEVDATPCTSIIVLTPQLVFHIRNVTNK